MTALMVAAPASGSGKSTVTMGLLRALCDRGLAVQPFKCGPDYIDPMFHRMAARRDSVNLDTVMMSPDHVVSLYQRYSAGADACVVEGVMGLFDGRERSQGSSAEIANLLGLPVVLVVNARSAAYSVGPLVRGFATWPGGPRVAGVIMNNEASPRHYGMLRDACDDAGVPCLGHLPRNPQLAIPSRHLGLTIDQAEQVEELIALAARELASNVDLDKILTL